jgi:hypothetical protein
LIEALLVERFGLGINPGDAFEQDACVMIRFAALQNIYEVMAKFRDHGGMKGLSRDEKVTAKEILDLEWADNKRVNGQHS